MKKLLFAIIAAASAWCASGQEIDLRNFHITSSNDVAAITSIPEWKRGVDTNGVTISVCVGYLTHSKFSCQPLFRNISFDKDGKLVYASGIITTRLSFCGGDGFSFNDFKNGIFTKTIPELRSFLGEIHFSPTNKTDKKSDKQE